MQWPLFAALVAAVMVAGVLNIKEANAAARGLYVGSVVPSRRDEKDPAGIFGMVEAVETGRVRRFTSVNELGSAICLTGKNRTTWKSGEKYRKP